MIKQLANKTKNVNPVSLTAAELRKYCRKSERMNNALNDIRYILLLEYFE